MFKASQIILMLQPNVMYSTKSACSRFVSFVGLPAGMVFSPFLVQGVRIRRDRGFPG
jgi:hypothetical protein